jgi:hypothetical protein
LSPSPSNKSEAGIKDSAGPSIHCFLEHLNQSFELRLMVIVGKNEFFERQKKANCIFKRNTKE